MQVPEYRYEDNPHNAMGAIKILNGDFCGLAYQYGIVSFSEGEEDCSINFTYEIIDNDKHFPENQEMKNVMGTILIDLLNRNYKDGYDNGTIDTEKSDS